MASSKKAGRARWRAIPVAFKVLALCLIALAALLMLLPAPPGGEFGGTTTITRRVPALRDTVDPLTNNLPQRLPSPGVVGAPPPAPAIVAAPQAPAPEVPAPEVPVTEVPAPNLPARKPVIARAPQPAPGPEWTVPREQLPKDEKTSQQTARLPSRPAPESDSAGGGGGFSKSEIRQMVKSQAWEFLGGVDAKGNILYRFEVWLDAPQNVLSRIDSVTYDYDAPSATPKSRQANQVIGGFRARFGALACSKDITVTVKMSDGSTRSARADGCQALN